MQARGGVRAGARASGRAGARGRPGACVQAPSSSWFRVHKGAANSPTAQPNPPRRVNGGTHACTHARIHTWPHTQHSTPARHARGTSPHLHQPPGAAPYCLAVCLGALLGALGQGAGRGRDDGDDVGQRVGCAELVEAPVPVKGEGMATAMSSSRVPEVARYLPLCTPV